jgi:hypothetical protein
MKDEIQKLKNEILDLETILASKKAQLAILPQVGRARALAEVEVARLEYELLETQGRLIQAEFEVKSNLYESEIERLTQAARKTHGEWKNYIEVSKRLYSELKAKARKQDQAVRAMARRVEEIDR